MTASDARPPSDWPCDNYLSPLTCLTAPSTETGRCDQCRARPPSDTGATGWHRWAALPQYAHRADDQTTTHDDCRPVLMVDPAEARETIAREIASWHDPRAWEDMPERNRAAAYEASDIVLAALGGQEGDRGE